jgi:hypothetical protein
LRALAISPNAINVCELAGCTTKLSVMPNQRGCRAR